MIISIVIRFYGTKVVRLWCYVVQSVQVLPIGQLVSAYAPLLFEHGRDHDAGPGLSGVAN